MVPKLEANEAFTMLANRLIGRGNLSIGEFGQSIGLEDHRRATQRKDRLHCLGISGVVELREPGSSFTKAPATNRLPTMDCGAAQHFSFVGT